MIFPSKLLTKTLFIDIETVSEFEKYENLTERYQSLWSRKAHQIHKGTNTLEEKAIQESYENSAAIYAEFGKVICISCGFYTGDQLRIKSIYGPDESLLLKEFAELLIHYYDDPDDYYLCGHNIKEFDIPYLCRRMVKHGIFMPNMLDIAGKKPWQTEHLIDTMALWRFGDYKNYTSLNLLTAMLDIPTPKSDIDGSMVGNVYYKEKNIERIAKYCANDVVAVAQIMMKYCGKALLENDQIVLVDE